MFRLLLALGLKFIGASMINYAILLIELPREPCARLLLELKACGRPVSFLIVDLLKRFIHVSAGAKATMSHVLSNDSRSENTFNDSGKLVVDWLVAEHARSSRGYSRFNGSWSGDASTAHSFEKAS